MREETNHKIMVAGVFDLLDSWKKKELKGYEGKIMLKKSKNR